MVTKITNNLDIFFVCFLFSNLSDKSEKICRFAAPIKAIIVIISKILPNYIKFIK